MYSTQCSRKSSDMSDISDDSTVYFRWVNAETWSINCDIHHMNYHSISLFDNALSWKEHALCYFKSTLAQGNELVRSAAAIRSPNATHAFTGRPKVLPWMVRLATNEILRLCRKYFGMKTNRRFSCRFCHGLGHFVTHHGKPWLFHDLTLNNGKWIILPIWWW